MKYITKSHNKYHVRIRNKYMGSRNTLEEAIILRDEMCKVMFYPPITLR